MLSAVAHRAIVAEWNVLCIRSAGLDFRYPHHTCHYRLEQ